MFKKFFFALVVVVAYGANVANAQDLIVANDIINTLAVPLPQAYEVELETGDATPLWVAELPVSGMAYGNSVLYVTSGADLYQGTISPTAPTNPVPLFMEGDTFTLNGVTRSIFFVPGGLAFANGDLYAIRAGGVFTLFDPDSHFGELARVNTTTGEVTSILTINPADYGFAGLAFNPDDGLFYATQNDPFVNEVRGLYSIDAFGNGDIELVTEYPLDITSSDPNARRFDIDGLAVGDGIVYLVEEITGETIHPFDLATGQYLPSITSPITNTSGSSRSGAVFIPAVDEPILLGDVNMDGVVSFLDISGFIAILSSNGFLDQADMNRDNVVSFLDIAPFIVALTGQ